MFENLTDKLERSFKILKGEGRITEINVAETLKEIRRALIDADVNYKVAKTFTDEVKQKALGQDVLKAVKPGQMMTKIVRDELAELMGGTATDIRLEGTPAVILIAGLQGSGKTTFSGKLASLLKSKKGRQVLLVAGDVYRPAAIDQLKVLGGQIGVEVYTEEGNRNPVEIAENGIKYARQKNYNVVIVDTEGRLAVDEAMMQEITAIKAAVKPSETLFVVDAMTGQDAVNTAREFNERLDFDGVVLTKLDGDTRGGAAISIRSVVNKPLKFISSGEKMDALQVLTPSAWPTESWAWATWCRSWNAHRSSSTRRRPASSKRNWSKTSSTSTTSSRRFSRSRRWATSRTSLRCSPAWARCSRTWTFRTMCSSRPRRSSRR